MPYFEYRAISADGQQDNGTLETDSMEQAAANLRQRGLMVVSLQETSNPENIGSVTNRRWIHRAAWLLPIMARDRATFFRQMSMMVQTGLTLLQALQICKKESVKKAFRDVIQQMINDVENGASFSSAMGRHKRVFSSVIVQLVESSEASGELESAMNRIAEGIERRSEQIVKLVSALFYPVFVMVVAMMVTLFLVYGVIPKFATFIERKGGQLPASTQFLMDLSKGAIAYLPYLLIGTGLVIMGFIMAWRNKTGRYRIHRILLDVPVIGGILTFSAISQFGFTLSTLIESGLTLVDSLRIAGKSVGNDAIQNHILKTREKIINGENFSTAIDDIIIPPTVSQVIAIGEQTGNLGEVLDEIGSYYDSRLQARIRWLSAITEPVMIIFVGGIVGFVYFSFFMAALGMSVA